MNFSVTSIRRPVLAIVMSLLIVLMGVVGYTFLGVRQFPDVDPPQITVTTSYRGANADVIEAQITEPLEGSINGIAGIRTLTSQSSYGRSQITVEFNLGEDLEAATNDVRDRVDQAKRNLPVDVDPPIVAKASANSNPVIIMAVASTQRSIEEVSEFAANRLKERLQTVPGVGDIQIWGERRPAMRIVLLPDRLSAYRLTTSDVRSALQRENVELPAGILEGTSTEMTMRTMGRLATVEDFENVILRSDAGSVVLLSDVARVYLGAENERTVLKRDGAPMIALAVLPQPGANQIDISREFRKRVEEIRPQLPSDISLELTFDMSTFITSAVTEVEETLLIAFGLVIVIIFFFLRSWRATIIPVVAIPVSLVSAFFFMWVAGFSINLLTLLGIVLATGLVVDDAIVVMENIYKKIEEGMDPREAGEKGSTEIYFAIISTTITLAVVFVPIIFLQGLTGRLFREFGLVVATSVLVSAFVSLTLTPMMSSRLLRKESHESWLHRITEPFFVWINGVYDRMLRSVVDHYWIAIVAMVVAIAIIVGIGTRLQSELAPLEDRSSLTVMMVAPEGYTYNRMDDFITQFRHTVDRLVPEKHMMFTVTSPSFAGGGSNSGFARLILIPPEKRDRTQMQIAAQLNAVLRQETEARTIVQQEQTIGSGMGRALPLQFVIQAPEVSDLRRVLPKFIERANADPTFGVVDFNLKFNKPEVNIVIKRERARQLGVSVMDIADALQAGYSGQRYGYFMRGGKQYQIIGEVDRAQRLGPEELSEMTVRASDGSMVQLTDLVEITEQSNPPQLYHYNRTMSATVSAALAPGKTLGDGIAVMDRIASEVLDENYSTALAGAALDFKESSSSILFAFVLALLLVYLILAAQFESFVDPLTIMLTVPLALAGGVVSLFITNETLNIFSEIGAIVLIGIVTKNGILIVEFANQLHEEGASWHDAVIKAASLRFRPILMTSLATVLGALPIALSLGASSGSRVGLGVVVVGGMLIATFLTLLVIPALYVLMSKLKKKKPHHHHPVAAVVSVAVLLWCVPQASAADTLTVRDAVRIALERSYDIQVARQDSLAARTTGKTSIVGYLPTLNVNGTYVDGANDLSQQLGDGRLIEQAGAGYTNANATAVLSWTLFDGLRMFAAADRASALEGEGLARVRSMMSFTIADVITAYNGIVANEEFLKTVDSALTLAEQRYTIEKHRYDVGSASGVEVAQAEIDRNSQRALVIRTRTEAKNARIALNTLLGRDPTTSFEVSSTIEVPSLPDRAAVRTAIDQTNPDVLAAENALAAASAHVREANATFMPRIAANGGYQYTRNTSEAGFLLENSTNGWNVGLTFQWNIFNGMSDAYTQELRKITEQRQRINIAALKNDLYGQSERTWQRYETATELLAIQRASYTAAEKNAVVALEKLKVGSITPLEVRQTFQSLLETGEAVARLDYERVLAATEILRIANALLR
jgi:multidrug efflux pump